MDVKNQTRSNGPMMLNEFLIKGFILIIHNTDDAPCIHFSLYSSTWTFVNKQPVQKKMTDGSTDCA